MSDEVPKRYEEIESKIEKSISPYITLKIPLPEGVDKGAFLELENDPKFIESLKKQVKKWLTEETSH